MTDKKEESLLEDRSREDGLSREKMRKDRTPLYKQSAVTLKNRDPLFHYRLVNDTPGRIAAFLEAGWEIVEGDKNETYSGKGRSEGAQDGSLMKRRVNEGLTAPCHNAYVMRIPKEFFAEDQEEKNRRNEELIEDIDPSGEIRRAIILGSRANIHSIKLKKSK
jgi:hypothetical protein